MSIYVHVCKYNTEGHIYTSCSQSVCSRMTWDFVVLGLGALFMLRKLFTPDPLPSSLFLYIKQAEESGMVCLSYKKNPALGQHLGRYIY